MAFRHNVEHDAMLDHMRRLEPDVPSRAEMIRRLIERGASNAGFYVRQPKSAAALA